MFKDWLCAYTILARWVWYWVREQGSKNNFKNWRWKANISNRDDPICAEKTLKWKQWWLNQFSSVQLLSRVCLCDPMNRSTKGLPVHHQLPEFTQTHVHRVGDAIQPSHPLSSPSPPALNLSQHQGLFRWVSSSHQVAKVLELQLQHQSFQWIFRTDFF